MASLKEIADQREVQEVLRGNGEKVSLSKLADMLIKENNLVIFKSLTWIKKGHGLEYATPKVINDLAVHTLKRFGLEDAWTSRSLSTLEAFLSAACPTIRPNTPPDWLFCENIVLDMRTGKAVEVPEDCAVVNIMPVKYDPKAKCPILDSGLHKAFSPEQLEAFLSIFGARLTGYTNMKTHLILSGDGNQAKGTWQTLIKKLFGKRVCSDPIAYINSQFRSKGFLGSDIIWNSETANTKDSHLLIKRVTGGTSIGIEQKGKDGYSEESYHAIFVEDTNSPNAPTPSAANYTRMEWIELQGHFVKESEYEANKDKPYYYLIEPGFEAKAFAPEELSGFLNMLLPYAKYYIENSDYKQHASKEIDRLADKSSSIDTFLREFVVVIPEHKIHVATLYKRYDDFCAKMKVEPMPRYKLKEIIVKEGAKKGAIKDYLKDVKFLLKDYKHFMMYGEFLPASKIDEGEEV